MLTWLRFSIWTRKSNCLVLLALIFFYTPQLLAPATSFSTTTTQYQIGVLYWSMNIPGQVAMRKGLEAKAESLNAQALADGKPGLNLIPFVAGEGITGIEKQILQMKALIQEKPDLIIVQPTDNAALAEPLRLANAAGIPVVAYDQYISGGELVSFLTSNNYQAGYLDGEYIASRFSTTHSIRIVMVEYPHVSSTVERVNGFLDALNSRGHPFRILQTLEAVEPVGGRIAGQSILKNYPEPGSIDVVFTVNDGGGLAVVETLHAAGRNEILHATVDGDPQSEKNILEKKITVVDCAQFCWHLGAEAMNTGWSVLNGESVEPVILLPVFPITIETQPMYKGWFGQAPGEFHKPWPSENPVWRWELTNPDGDIISTDSKH